MYAPLFESADGKKFVVASREMVFSSWLPAVLCVNYIISQNRWNMVQWSGTVIDVTQHRNDFGRYTYMGVPVLVLQDE